MALLLYGRVGGDFSARTVAEYLKANKKGAIHVRIDSPGGDVFAGTAIYNLLRTSGRRVEVEIDGMAASAASVIAMAGDDIAISEGGFVMIHRSSSLAMGNAEQIGEQVAILEKIDEVLAGIYARRTAQSPNAVRDMMAAETWMNADDAISKGFANRRSSASARVAAMASPSEWANAPAEVKARLQVNPTSATVVAQGHNKDDMSPEQLQAAIEAALAPVAARLAALEAVPQASASPAPAAAPAPAADEPVVTIEEAVEDDAAADVRTMYFAAVDAAFDRFCAQGKLTPAAKEHFVAASQTPASFKAVCAMYETAPAVVSSQPIVAAPPASSPTRAYSAETLAWAKQSGVDLNKLDANTAKDSK